MGPWSTDGPRDDPRCSTWPVFVSAGLPESAAAIERLAAFLKGQAILAKLR
jgi:hypothetical protein